MGGVVLGLLAACNAPKVANDSPSVVSEASELIDVHVHARYAGYVRLPHIDPSQVLAREALVVRDRSAFDAFVDRIPEHRLQKRQPAPPSDDPLLDRPPVDFERRTMVVLIRGDTPWGTIEVKSLHREGDRVRVHREHPPLPDEGPLAQPMGIGTYVALVVDRFDGPLLVDDQTTP